MNTQEAGFMDELGKSEEFQRALQYELLIEGFLNRVDQHLLDHNISRDDLASMVGLDPFTLDNIFKRTFSLSVETMSDIAWALSLSLSLTVTLKD